MRTRTRRGVGVMWALGLGLCVGGSELPLPRELQVAARLLTPGIAAAQPYGTSRRVARRTARRTSARHSGYGYGGVGAIATLPPAAHYVTSMPAGCVATTVGAVTYQRCGSTYYRPYYQGDTLVYVVESP